jgi:hypothetical protein
MCGQQELRSQSVIIYSAYQNLWWPFAVKNLLNGNISNLHAQLNSRYKIVTKYLSNQNFNIDAMQVAGNSSL